MLDTLGIVEIRREPGRADLKIGRKLGGKSLLEWVVRRVTDCQQLDGVIVVLGDSEHDELVRQLVPPDVPVFIGNGHDALARFSAAVQEYGAKAAVRVFADNPFIDPVLIDRLVTTAAVHPACDYISYCSADGRPTILTQLGVCAEWCRAESLETANRQARRAGDRQGVTGFLYAHPERFNVRLIPLPAELDREDLRLKVDFEEDWEHAQVIYEALGPEEWDWQRIADLLVHQPALRKRMAVLNRSKASV